MDVKLGKTEVKLGAMVVVAMLLASILTALISKWLMAT
jgi:hypothetical protein